jgi:thiamine transport system ATP-binding protein
VADSESSTESAVELDGVTRTYATTTAVDDVSLTVREGEFFTLVGPSGCGKTTTLRLVGGFESPTAGTIRLDGESVAGVPPEDRDVGVVFQNYALFPHMSVRENVAYGLNFAPPPGGVGRDERVDELLDLVDLAGMGERDPDELSGGQQQRVAMARALAPGPHVLLLDEPMSALDARLRERLRVQIREIQRELSITTLYVTHDQEEALAISDRVAVMHDGGIEQVGPPREIYRRPATRFVADFIGDNNVFTGEVTAVDQRASGHDGVCHASISLGEQTVVVALEESVSVGDSVVFCVRPENLTVNSETNALTATVRESEFLGDRTRVHLDWEGQEILARSQSSLAGSVTVGFDPADAHVVRVR